MAKKNIRCVLLIMLAVILASGILNGCGKKEAGEEEGGSARSAVAKGRYVEEEIELPFKEGAIGFSKSGDGNPLVFSCADGKEVKRFEYKDGKWEEASLEWLQKVCDRNDIYMVNATETKDGLQLVIGCDDEQKTSIFRSNDGKSGEILEIPYLEKKTEYGYPAIRELQVDSAGNYWLQDAYQSKAVVISGDTLETVDEIATRDFSSDDQKMLFAGEDGNLGVNTEDGKIVIYDKNMKEQGALSFDQEQREGGSLCSDGENWYMVSEEGIVRMKPGDDSREVIMDGSMGTMGSPVNCSAGIICTENGEFYVLYTQWKAMTSSLAHYVYDKDVAAVPEHTLQVFGLSENDTIRQAITGFQRMNPDVKVEFKTSGKEEDEVTSDDIRTLNTELLSGKGADILLLNGLPADAYIEKGILNDLTELSEKLMKENDYLEGILKNTVQKGGKIYGLPVKYTVPVMYGDEQIENALESLDTLDAYLEKNPDAQIFGITGKEYIRDFLFQVYQDELIGEDGSVDKAKLKQALQIAVDIEKNSKTGSFDEMEMDDSSMQNSLFNNPGSMYIVKHPDMVATDRVGSLANMMMPCEIVRQQKLTLKSLKGFYIPEGIAGINGNTKEKELAEEFLSYLFSKEVQEAQLDDGFPVLTSALEAKEEEAESNYAAASSIYVGWNLDGEDITLEAGYPEAEEVKEFIEICKTLERPANIERAVWSIYREEADKVLSGSAGAEEGAENIRKKVELYLAE